MSHKVHGEPTFYADSQALKAKRGHLPVEPLQLQTRTPY